MVDHEKRLAALLLERKKNVLAEPRIEARYEQMLLAAFPNKRATDECFYPNTFTDSDEMDYLRFRSMFENKVWHEVNLHALYEKHVEFFLLTTEGKLHFLPTFLRFFYDLRHLELRLFDEFLFGLEIGLKPSAFEDLDMSLRGEKTLERHYDSFAQLNHTQSKMVSVFLVNVANLFPSESYTAQQAQRALTNYWGNFLLF